MIMRYFNVGLDRIDYYSFAKLLSVISLALLLCKLTTYVFHR